MRSAFAAPFHDRGHSGSSTAGSQKSSTFSNSSARYKLSSQASLIPNSPLGPPRKGSRPSSVTQGVGPGNVARGRGKRVRSQYPLNSSERHVEYILVASFDIDRGPIMEHQFPGAISPDESMLAELMLPDQTHVRTQDWTMFFLHKDAAVEQEVAAEREERQARRRERRLERENALQDQAPAPEQVSSDESSSDEEEDEAEDRDGPPLMYVLNLVNTKQDITVKR